MKQEKVTPVKKKQKEAEPAEGSAAEELAEDEDIETVQPEPEAKAKAAPKPKAAPKAKPGNEEELPAPGQKAWKDVHAQCQKLAKAGDNKLRSAWEKAKEAGTQKAKREFYYNVFLLDPAVSKKAVHKVSLERLQETEKVKKGWLTKFQIGTLQGANPNDPNFATLCDLAVKGLEERPHEVQAWADEGICQYKVSKEMMKEEVKTKESTTEARQHVEELDAGDFQQAERALMVQPETRQLTLGSKKKGQPEEPKALENTKPSVVEEYKDAYKSLKKAVGQLSISLDKASLLQASLKSATQTPQLGQSCLELEQLVKDYTKKKGDWQAKLGSFKETLEESEGDGKKFVLKMNTLKKQCDEDCKSLQKAVGPHKMWAKNHGLV